MCVFVCMWGGGELLFVNIYIVITTISVLTVFELRVLADVSFLVRVFNGSFFFFLFFPSSLC